ncbi:MAG: hypothetical protein Q8L48_27735 [Archangium sp.]|nr:hypothetical protein [Archangium sp.]
MSPQGSISPSLQYGLLACFVCVAMAYGVAWRGALTEKSGTR